MLTGDLCMVSEQWAYILNLLRNVMAQILRCKGLRTRGDEEARRAGHPDLP
jgi:hypothetical protein